MNKLDKATNSKSTIVLCIAVLLLAAFMCIHINSGANTHSKRKVSKKHFKTTLTINK